MPRKARWRLARRTAAAGLGLLILATPAGVAAQDLVLGANLGAHVACHGTTSHPCIFLRTGAYLGVDVGRIGVSANFAHVPGVNHGRSYDLFNYWGALDVQIAPHLWAILGAGTRRTRIWNNQGLVEWRGGLDGVLGASFRDDLSEGSPVKLRVDLVLEASDYEDGVEVVPANTLRVEPVLTLGLGYKLSLH